MVLVPERAFLPKRAVILDAGCGAPGLPVRPLLCNILLTLCQRTAQNGSSWDRCTRILRVFLAGTAKRRKAGASVLLYSGAEGAPIGRCRVRAVVLKEDGQIHVADVADARLKDESDVLARVTLAAICGTDVHIKHGGLPGIGPGSILGHEFVGVVEEVGSSVRRFQVGDRVASPPALWCGTCAACQSSVLQNCSQLSMYGGGPFLSPMGLDGVQAELVRVPNADLVLTPIPASVPDEQALLVVDMLLTGYHAANEANIKVADTVAVSGCGPVGLCAILSRLATRTESSLRHRPFRQSSCPRRALRCDPDRYPAR